jgi:hypothetical protein
VIVRYIDGGTLVDVQALHVHFRQQGRHHAIQTIRARCEPARRDEQTGRWLYDLKAASDRLANVKVRRRHTRRRAA